MTKQLLAILLLLPLSVSADEVDGKAVICKKENSDQVKGYRFQQGEVRGDFISDLGLSIGQNGDWEMVKSDYSTTVGREGVAYVLERTEIRWTNKGMSHELDRQTLELDYHKTFKFQCDVFQSHGDYWKQMENVRLEMQQKADEEKKKNKI